MGFDEQIWYETATGFKANKKGEFTEWHHFLLD